MDEHDFIQYYRGIQIDHFLDDGLYYARVDRKWACPSKSLEEIHLKLQTVIHRDTWAGRIQKFLEDRLADAPDETCHFFARYFRDETAKFLSNEK